MREFTAEELAEEFHAVYERLAPGYGKPSNRMTARPWPDLPETERDLMVDTAREIMEWMFAPDRWLV